MRSIFQRGDTNETASTHGRAVERRCLTDQRRTRARPGHPLRRQAADERAEAALAAVGLAHRRHARALDLAYAERKFRSIARILASGARLWLLDEPASGLDPGSYERFIALLGQPRCLILDEPSIGLAPKLFQDLMQPIRALQQARGMSILLVEQNVREALKVSDRVVVMKAGRMVRKALPGELKDNAALMELY